MKADFGILLMVSAIPLFLASCIHGIAVLLDGRPVGLILIGAFTVSSLCLLSGLVLVFAARKRAAANRKESW